MNESAVTIFVCVSCRRPLGDTNEMFDQPGRGLAVPRLDVGGHRDVHRGGDLGDPGDQVVERHALVVRLADRIGHRMAADRQRRKTRLDRQLGRPGIPHRG